MRIRWVNHPNPNLQHLNGKIVHEAREAVAPYLLSGQAVVAHYTSTIDFLRETSEQQMNSLSEAERDSTKVRWHVERLPRSQKCVVVRVHLSEHVIYGEDMPEGGYNKKSAAQLVDSLKKAGCPKEVIEQWRSERDKPDYLAQQYAAHEAAKKAQEEQLQREQLARRIVLVN
jgi:imidazolonepropionase-like amidohydrolase